MNINKKLVPAFLKEKENGMVYYLYPTTIQPSKLQTCPTKVSSLLIYITWLKYGVTFLKTRIFDKL